MKKLISLLLTTLPLLSFAGGSAMAPSVSPATQAEVNAGAVTSKFVSPATLRGSGLYPQISSVVLFVDATAIQTTNANQSFSQIPDISGLGNHLGVPFDTNELSYSDWFTNAIVQQGAIGGQQAIYFPQVWAAAGNNVPVYALTNNIWTQPMNTNCTVTMVIQNMNETDGSQFNQQQATAFLVGTNGGGGNAKTSYSLFLPWYSTQVNAGCDLMQSAAYSTVIPVQARHEPYVVTVSFQNGYIALWRDGVKIFGTNQSPYKPMAQSDTKFTVGMMYYTSKYRPENCPSNFKLGAMIVTSNSIPDAQIMNIHNWAMNKFGIGGGPSILLFGDSNTSSQGAQPNTNLIASLHKVIPSAMIQCFGIAGATTAGQLIAVTNYLATRMAPKATTDLALWWTGYNEINSSITFATWSNGIIAAGNLFASNGIPWAICTLPDNAYETNATQTISRTQINNFIYTNRVFNNQAIVDYASEPQFQTNGSYLVFSNNYQTAVLPGVHFSADVYDRFVAHWTAPAVSYLLGESGSRYAAYYGGTNTLFTHVTNGVATVNALP